MSAKNDPTFLLSGADTATVVHYLENPPSPSPALKRAFAARKRLFVTRQKGSGRSKKTG